MAAVGLTVILVLLLAAGGAGFYGLWRARGSLRNQGQKPVEPFIFHLFGTAVRASEREDAQRRRRRSDAAGKEL